MKKVEIVCIQCGQTKVEGAKRKLCSSCRTLNSFVGKGIIRESDFPDVTVAGYKQPMTKVEDGFGYLGAITTTKDGKHIQCHICGYFFGRLANHKKLIRLNPRTISRSLVCVSKMAYYPQWQEKKLRKYTTVM